MQAVWLSATQKGMGSRGNNICILAIMVMDLKFAVIESKSVENKSLEVNNVPKVVWMTHLFDRIANKRISDMVIPGTYASAAYLLGKSVDLAVEEEYPMAVSHLLLAKHKVKSFFLEKTKWVWLPGQCIFNLLEAGIQQPHQNYFHTTIVLSVDSFVGGTGGKSGGATRIWNQISWSQSCFHETSLLLAPWIRRWSRGVWNESNLQFRVTKSQGNSDIKLQ